MDKGKIIFRCNEPVEGKGSSPIRIKSKAFLEIERISNATGQSMSYIATRLVTEALKHVELID